MLATPIVMATRSLIWVSTAPMAVVVVGSRLRGYDKNVIERSETDVKGYWMHVSQMSQMLYEPVLAEPDLSWTKPWRH
jgi:hypothetical protein